MGLSVSSESFAHTNNKQTDIAIQNGIKWPVKHDIFGVHVSATNYEEALQLIMGAAKQGLPAIVDHMPVHGLILASGNLDLKAIMNRFDIVAPDGQPLRWALNRIHGTNLSDRVYGPELMLKLCRKAAEIGVGIYLYGSLPHVVEELRVKLLTMFPAIKTKGCESPPFRPLSREEDKEAIDRINQSGAGIVFLGLGCPKQEIFAYEHRHSIKAVQICVGAAFDFHAGHKKMAPAWMQRNSLEWLFRLSQEPGRLWKRYILLNMIFILKFFWQYTGLRNYK